VTVFIATRDWPLPTAWSTVTVTARLRFWLSSLRPVEVSATVSLRTCPAAWLMFAVPIVTPRSLPLTFAARAEHDPQAGR